MEARIIVDVRNYRLVLPNGLSPVLLQSPVSNPDKNKDDLFLVRQDSGAKNNQVNLQRRPANLAEDVHLQQSTFAHGILVRPSRTGDYQRGDQVWLAEEAEKLRKPRHDPKAIDVFNLRTWKRLTVSLDDVCWVPKYRKLERGDGEELLTISGPPVRRPDRKAYILAVVQRLYNQSCDGNTDAHLEVREMVEQDMFRYDNLQKQGSLRIVEELFQRRMASMARISTPNNTLSPEAASSPSRPISSQRAASALATPPPEDDGSPVPPESDPDSAGMRKMIMDKAMALIRRSTTIPVCQAWSAFLTEIA